jgi:hypothetical protein
MSLYVIGFETKIWKGIDYNGPPVYTAHQVRLYADSQEDAITLLCETYKAHQGNAHFPFSDYQISFVEQMLGNLDAIPWLEEFFAIY